MSLKQTSTRWQKNQHLPTAMSRENTTRSLDSIDLAALRVSFKTCLLVFLSFLFFLMQCLSKRSETWWVLLWKLTEVSNSTNRAVKCCDKWCGPTVGSACGSCCVIAPLRDTVCTVCASSVTPCSLSALCPVWGKFQCLGFFLCWAEEADESPASRQLVVLWLGWKAALFPTLLQQIQQLY